MMEWDSTGWSSTPSWLRRALRLLTVPALAPHPQVSASDIVDALAEMSDKMREEGYTPTTAYVSPKQHEQLARYVYGHLMRSGRALRVRIFDMEVVASGPEDGSVAVSAVEGAVIGKVL